jgi:hypothetical protein
MSPRMQGRSPRGQVGPLPCRAPGGGRLPLRSLRRGELPARLARLGDDLLLRLQLALRLLPEPRHLLAAAGRAGLGAAAGGNDARAPSQGLSQHQLGDARTRGAADPRGPAAGGGGWPATSNRLQHERLRLARQPRADGRDRRHVHARLQALVERARASLPGQARLPRGGKQGGGRDAPPGGRARLRRAGLGAARVS